MRTLPSLCKIITANGKRSIESALCVCAITSKLLSLSDLEFGLPVQVRDYGLSVKDNLPQSDVNKEYYLQNMDNQVCVCVCVCVCVSC